MTKFAVGDRIRYVSGRFRDDCDSNPLWDGRLGKIVGTVKRLNTEGLPVSVAWDNGHRNSYEYNDLEIEEHGNRIKSIWER
jgi:hypothetical protein